MLCVGLTIAGFLAPLQGGTVVRLDPSQVDLRDPRLDGWVTEAFAEDVGKALAPLKEQLAHGPPESPERAKGEDAEELPDALGNANAFLIAPAGIQTVRETPSVIARRFDASTDGSAPRPDAQPINAVVDLLRGPMAGDLHAKIKVTSVRAPQELEPLDGVSTDALSAGHWSTNLLIEVGGHDSDTGWHAVATLEAHWAQHDDGPHLLACHLASFESTELRIPGGRLFEDVTASVLAGESAWTEQLLVGQDRWARRIEERLGMGLYRHCGIAVGDANGDGLEDLYVAQPAGLPNLLLLKAADGILTNAAPTADVDWLDHTSSALFADLDGDGDQDLVATVAGTVVVHENLGAPPPATSAKLPAPRFQRRAVLAGDDNDLYGLSAADVDGDGDLDIYVTADFATRRRDEGSGERARFDYVDANDGGKNVLWRNDGNLRFTDATQALGLDVHNRRHSLAATWRDIDRDGDVDLYVANDYGQNCLYVNRSERSPAEEGQANSGPLFVECAADCGLEDRGSGMSVDIGDPNRDGSLDVLVANMWSSAGRRVVPQEAFGAAASPEQREQFSRFAKGNTLFLGATPTDSGTRRYSEASTDCNIERGRWAWGSPFVDIDGDGWEDMLVGNGYVTSFNSGDL